jgi:hypothetical protein
MRLAGRQNWTDFRAKTANSLHRCAMIEKVFSDTISDFAKFIPPKELVCKLTVN